MVAAVLSPLRLAAGRSEPPPPLFQQRCGVAIGAPRGRKGELNEWQSRKNDCLLDGRVKPELDELALED